MYIITAIPLDYIPKEAGETFSFFSAQLLTKGSLIEAHIKKRLVKLLIADVNPLKDYKASLRKSDFALSPVSKVLWETPFLQDTHYEIARYLGSYYNESLGSYLKLIFPFRIWKQLKKINLTLPNLKNNSSNNTDININYINNNIIGQTFKDLFKNNDGQSLIICPTLTHLQYLEEQIQNIAPDVPLLIYRKDSGTKDLVTFYKKFAENSNVIILGLQSAIFLPFFNLKSIVIYDYKQRGQFSIDQHPYFTTTKIAAMWSKLTGCRLIVTAILPDTEIIKLSGKYLENLPHLKKQELEIVDLKKMSVEMKTKIILAPNVLNQVKQALTQNKKVLIFLNRKGLAHYIICKDCGKVPHCSHCQKPLTLREHGAGRELICRSCGYKQLYPTSALIVILGILKKLV
jgi:primosomal protein N'